MAQRLESASYQVWPSEPDLMTTSLHAVRAEGLQLASPLRVVRFVEFCLELRVSSYGHSSHDGLSVRKAFLSTRARRQRTWNGRMFAKTGVVRACRGSGNGLFISRFLSCFCHSHFTADQELPH